MKKKQVTDEFSNASPVCFANSTEIREGFEIMPSAAANQKAKAPSTEKAKKGKLKR